MYTIDVDIGGTFTDGFFSDGSRVKTAKIPTTPHDVTECFMSCVEAGSRAFGLDLPDFLRNASVARVSTTIGTNLLVQRAGPRLGLFVTRGHESDLYGNGQAALLGRYIAADMVAGITESVDGDGDVVEEPDVAEVLPGVRRLLDGGARMIVVSFRNAWRNAHNERLVRAQIRDRYPAHYLRSVPLQLGTEVMHVADDHARTNSAVLNAYIHADMARALYRAEDRLRAAGYARPLLVVQASGGTARVAKTVAIQTLHSGPAVAAKGAACLSKVLGERRVVSTDMGGTSFDVALLSDHDAETSLTPRIEGIPVGMPMITIESIGAGGGSIARVVAGELVVGPESAGAVPGPVCYGKGGIEPTVTDANVVLGYIDPAFFLGGRMRLDAAAARRAIERRLAHALGVSPEEAAFNVREAIGAHMAREIDKRLRERGLVPGDFCLFSVGGAGPLHACAIADRVGIRRVIAFAFGSVFSAFGSSTTDMQHVYTRTLEHPLLAEDDLGRIVEELREQALTDMSGEGFAQAAVRLALEVHVRGGTRPLVVSLEAAHRDLRSHIVKATGARGGNVWLEMLRLRAEATVARWVPGRAARGGKRLPPRKGERSIHWERAKPTDTVLYDRFALAPTHRIVGPALIEGDDTAYPVPPEWTATVDAYGNFVIERTR